MQLDKKDLAWKGITLGIGAAAGFATERLLSFLWSTSMKSEPPVNPADRRTSWPEAISWAIATGVGIGVARLAANRGAAAVWEAATAEAPPGIQPDRAA